MSNDPTSSIRIWPYPKAPADFLRFYRELHGETGDEELVIHIPGQLLDANGELDAVSPALWFLDWVPKYANHEQYAGDDWGWFSMHDLSDNGRLLVTRDSVRRERG
jgi:hypothetical protein